MCGNTIINLTLYGMALKKIELRVAEPADLKFDQQTLKIGQPYAICSPDEESVQGFFVLKGDEDPFVLRMFLQKEMIYIPLVDHSLSTFMKNED